MALPCGTTLRLLAFLCVAAVAHAQADSSSVAASISAGSDHSRRLHSDVNPAQSSSAIDANYPLEHGRKCGTASVTGSEFRNVQSAILGNWLIRNSVSGFATLLSCLPCRVLPLFSGPCKSSSIDTSHVHDEPPAIADRTSCRAYNGQRVLQHRPGALRVRTGSFSGRACLSYRRPCGGNVHPISKLARRAQRGLFPLEEVSAG